ncbi:unnamed protein product [Cochlearia groenlandica]
MPRRKANQGLKLTLKEEEDKEIIRREEKKADEDEVERQVGAVRAMRDVEFEQMITSLRLLRSYFIEEQIHTNSLDFFRDNLPGLTVEDNGELKFKETGDVDVDGDGVYLNESLLKHLSLFTKPSSSMSLGGYDLPDEGMRASLLGTDNTHIQNLVFQGTSEKQMFASHDALRTPEVNGQRLSFGMTPKTRRLPKHGEMMLSVHGSPLGVFKEDHNMGAIKGLLLIINS